MSEHEAIPVRCAPMAFQLADLPFRIAMMDHGRGERER
jgi:hypothetical protein